MVAAPGERGAAGLCGAGHRVRALQPAGTRLSRWRAMSMRRTPPVRTAGTCVTGNERTDQIRDRKDMGSHGGRPRPSKSGTTISGPPSRTASIASSATAVSPPAWQSAPGCRSCPTIPACTGPGTHPGQGTDSGSGNWCWPPSRHRTACLLAPPDDAAQHGTEGTGSCLTDDPVRSCPRLSGGEAALSGTHGAAGPFQAGSALA